LYGIGEGVGVGGGGGKSDYKDCFSSQKESSDILAFKTSNPTQVTIEERKCKIRSFDDRLTYFR
jgi:hypothetical protein